MTEGHQEGPKVEKLERNSDLKLELHFERLGGAFPDREQGSTLKGRNGRGESFQM